MNNQNKDNTVEIVFSYELKKDNKVFIYWYDKLLKILTGEKAKKFLDKVEGKDDAESQIIMAKTTNNIKRGKIGNEKFIVVRGTHYTKNMN